MFASRPSVANPVVGLNALVGLVGLWVVLLDWVRGSESLIVLFASFLFRATRTQGPKGLSSGPA